MTRLARGCVGASIALGAALALIACSSPFSQDSADGGFAEASADGGTPDAGGGRQGDAQQQDAPGTGKHDGGLDASQDGTALDAGGGIHCQGAFSSPTQVLSHSTTYLVDSITLTTDELDAFVTLFPKGSTTEQRQVFAMHRSSASVAFTMDTSHPVDLTSTGPTPGAFDVGLSADDLTLYFSHRQDSDAGLLGVNIYEALRGDAGAPFAGVVEFGPAIDDPTTNQFHAHRGGPNLYFTVTPLVGGAQGQRDLYVAPLQGGARAAITELNGATTQEATPVPSRDELEIFFSSDRAAPGGANGVYSARRNAPDVAFSLPAPVALGVPGGAATNVTPQHLSADSCRLYVLVDQQDAYVVQRAAQ